MTDPAGGLDLRETSPVGAPAAGPDGAWPPRADVPGTDPGVGPVPPGPARTGRRWPRMLPSTLTGRLVLGVVGLVILIVAVTGGTTYALLRPYLTGRLDQQLGPIADANARRLAVCQSIGSSTCSFGGPTGYRAPQKQWIALIQDSSEVPLTVQGNGQDLAVMELTQSDIALLGHTPTKNDTIRTVDGVQLRVAVRSVPGSALMVATGLSTGDEHYTLDRLLLLEVAIGAGAVVLASLATAAGVRLQLRGLHRVTRTAREVSAELSPDGGGLDRRVPVEQRTSTEVEELADSVNTMLGAVESEFAARVASEERMRRFLADASHELRTPLTSIRGYAELARMHRAMGSDADPETLDRIEAEGTRMSRLVEDLLMLARSDQGAEPQRQLLALPQLVDDVAAGVRAAHPDRPISADVPPGLTVLADPDQLIRVLRNLITNAAVHTAPGGPIEVSARRVEVAGGTGTSPVIEIAVRDRGPGLPPEDAAHVFERFWRADKARTRAKGGSGLGLAIVASIVETHGGSVAFDSSVEGGSTVTVRLPG